MLDKVNLKTTYLQTGEVKITGTYEREALEQWVKRSKRENSNTFLDWEVVEVEENE